MDGDDDLMLLEEADIDEREDSPRDAPARLVKLEDRCALDFRAASLDDPGIEMGEVDEGPARSLSVAEPSSASVVLLSRFEEEGVEPPELWLRSRRPNSVLYMTRRGLVRQKLPLSLVFLQTLFWRTEHCGSDSSGSI